MPVWTFYNAGCDECGAAEVGAKPGIVDLISFAEDNNWLVEVPEHDRDFYEEFPESADAVELRFLCPKCNPHYVELPKLTVVD